MKKLLAGVIVAGLAVSAHATPLYGDGYTITPLILSGALPDTPAARVDPNTTTSRFSGVVSINIRYDGLSFICSGALVSSRHVVTAGHCVDTDGQGHVIDVSQPFAVSGKDVRVVFNNSDVIGSPDRAVVTASAVSMNPNYAGFGNCPPGVPGFCVNDDVAVVTLSEDAPASAKIYPVFSGEVGVGQLATLAGYGISGDGINGFTIGPNFRIKRTGGNVLDIFEGDDETFMGFDANGFIIGAGSPEVWYADFDGTNSGGVLMDTDCVVFSVCTTRLANNIETNIGGGDSGGPSFIERFGDLYLVANNTFGWSGWGEENPGAFGSLFGGVLLYPYLAYLEEATGGAVVVVPEPAVLTLVGLGLAGLVTTRRRKK